MWESVDEVSTQVATLLEPRTNPFMGLRSHIFGAGCARIHSKQVSTATLIFGQAGLVYDSLIIFAFMQLKSRRGSHLVTLKLGKPGEVPTADVFDE